MKYDVAVIGAGASGMLAAVSAAEAGATVLLIERNRETGLKIGLTGKGRCNLTNNCDLNTFLENVPVNPRFLYRALTDFSPADTMDYFESIGVKLKTERGRRVFPQSDSAQEVRRALRRECEKRCRLVQGRADGILMSGGAVCGVTADGREYASRAVIVATGGLSYPRTGSTGDGYRFAREAGHTVTPLRGSLVPIVCTGKLCGELMGLSLRNIALSASVSGKTVYRGEGEMLFTHFGVSGPLVLSASALIAGRYPAELTIDLKPALDRETLDRRLLREFGDNPNKDYVNLLGALLPAKLVPVFAELSGIDPRRKANGITREERSTVVSLLKEFWLTAEGTRPPEEAVVTSGGVCVKEINPSTMESRLVKGLYFAGEVIDVDAYTGGYNLQIAFSTGRLAGLSAAKG
ncbi:MAG: NAD(P)/FAD-dependent oxidoreductase [Clostridiales bacterium]|nr:NAD(P)/FAD-dependent oxidoreductase [Clostridiales bacterium]